MENRTGMVIQINRDSLRKIIKLQAENKVLKKWIDNAQHHNYCRYDVSFDDAECSCGMDDILNDSN